MTVPGRSTIDTAEGAACQRKFSHSPPALDRDRYLALHRCRYRVPPAFGLPLRVERTPRRLTKARGSLVGGIRRGPVPDGQHATEEGWVKDDQVDRQARSHEQSKESCRPTCG